MNTYETIIVGSGIAALQLCRHLKPASRILLLTKSALQSTNSYRAQGGVAAAVDRHDHPSFHYEDTIAAGCRFHNEKEVCSLVEDGPSLIKDLEQLGVPFDRRNDGNFALGREGAHRKKRIVHSGGDQTGKRLMDTLIDHLPPSIEVREHSFVFELLIHPIKNSCIGVKAMNRNGQVENFYSPRVVLATGGVGGLYEYTSNDPAITGDGIALAASAGAELVNMEFIQFHPTLLFAGGKTHGLVTEAIRGEGGRLMTGEGSPLMAGVHPQGDLAPRHIVAQAIYEARARGEEVYLDISRIESFSARFPTVTNLCDDAGISAAGGRLPVTPGCHFLMGGIAVDENSETTINGLYAIGETACTGVHGANRLASNSLLEGLHYGKRLAAHLNATSAKLNIPSVSLRRPSSSPAAAAHLPTAEQLRADMMEAVGIVRCGERLRSFLNRIERLDVFMLEGSLDDWSIDQIQQLFMAQTACLIARGAYARQESRGGHIRSDFPFEDEFYGTIQIIQTKNRVEKRGRQHEHHQITSNA